MAAEESKGLNPGEGSRQPPPDALQTAAAYAVELTLNEEFTAYPGRASRIVTALPRHPETGEPLADAPWMHFAGGFGCDTLPYIHSLAQQGWQAFSLLTRYQRRPDNRFLVVAQTPTGTERIIARPWEARALLKDPAVQLVVSFDRLKQAGALLVGMERQAIGQTSGIFQSADASNGLLAASKAPDALPYIVQAYPGSYVRRPPLMPAVTGGLRRYLPRNWVAASNSFKDCVPSAETARVYGSRLRPPLVGFVLGASALVSYQTHWLALLRTRAKAPAVAWVAALDDIVFAPELLLQSLQHPDDIRYLLVTEGPHGYQHRKDAFAQTLELFPMMQAQDATQAAVAAHGQPYTLPPLSDRLLLPSTMPPRRAAKLRDLAQQVGST